MTEEAILLGASRSLVGVVTDPPSPTSPRAALILLNAGIIHRVGPGRMYVKLARRAATLGLVALRFDFSGIGDSPSRRDNLPFERNSIQETQDAMDYLARTRGVSRFVLGGLCTGAVVAYQTALVETRVAGTLLINGQGYIPESEEMVHAYLADRSNRRYYFGRALYDPRSWLRLFSGRVDYAAILRALGSGRRVAPGQAAGSSDAEEIRAGLHALADRGTELFFLYSDGDPGIDELQLILRGAAAEFRARDNVRYEMVQGADHMFTALAKQERFLGLTGDWLEEMTRRLAEPALLGHQA